MARTLFVSLLLLSVTASARWGDWLPNVNIGWGNGGYNQPQRTWAYQGQYCSYYQGYGPQCVQGLVCTSGGFNVGFGVCQPAYGYGNNNGGWNNGGWGHDGGNHGGCHH